MMKTTGSATPETYYTMTCEGAFITKVSNSGTEEGNVTQKVEMVFKKIQIDYSQQGVSASSPGTLSNAGTFKWDIPSGDASPSDGG